MDLFDTFTTLQAATSAVDFLAVPLAGHRSDYLAKAADGSPVFLLQDSGPASYSPPIELKNVSVQFHRVCRVASAGAEVEDQFALICCDANVPELYELFVRCVAVAVERLPAKASTSELQRCVQAVLELFRALGQPSGREVTGLWAELFVISRSKGVGRALSAWHADPFERFDFSWSTGRLEVKASTKEIRQHEFALEQLHSPSSGAGYVASVLLQPLGGGAGVVDLARLIEKDVATEPELRHKLWGNIAAALGSDFSERLDRRFDVSYAERSLAVFAMGDVPAPEEPRDPRVTGVRFRSDLSDVRSSLTGKPKDILDSFFS